MTPYGKGTGVTLRAAHAGHASTRLQEGILSKMWRNPLKDVALSFPAQVSFQDHERVDQEASERESESESGSESDSESESGSQSQSESENESQSESQCVSRRKRECERKREHNAARATPPTHLSAQPKTPNPRPSTLNYEI